MTKSLPLCAVCEGPLVICGAGVIVGRGGGTQYYWCPHLRSPQGSGASG
jgi:putative intracellular protease/amidase